MVYPKPKKLVSISDQKVVFDNHLEDLSKSISLNKVDEICTSSSAAIKELDNNIWAFKQIEPYYNWEEIKNVLIATQRRHCDQVNH